MVLLVGFVLDRREPEGCGELRDNTMAAPDDVPGSGARAYVLGDSWRSGCGRASSVPADAEVVLVEGHGGTFVDTTGWALPYIQDRVHLTPEGHRALAERLAEVIGRN